MIISAAICDKSGDILVGRQFSHITKHQLEESIRNFPALIQADQQHTFVETEYVRYLYLPLEEMFLVLLTKKSSNIIEDQETIRLLHKIVQELCSSSGLSHDTILEHDFEILLSFDDVISQGMRESVTLQQVQNSLSMESEDERLHIMLMKQKQQEQNEAIKRHQQEMELKRKQGKVVNSNSISSSSYGSMGSGSNSSSNISSGVNINRLNSEFSSKSQLYGNDDNEGVYQETEKPVYNKNTSKATTTAPKSGMVLGKKSKVAQQKEAQATLKNEIAASLKGQDSSVGTTAVGGSTTGAATTSVTLNPLKAPIEVEILEKISAQIQRDGSVKSMDVNGDVFLQFFDPSKARVALQFDHEALPANAMKPHINLNKQLWMEKKQIALKNIEASFPVNTRVPSVKYRYASADPSSDCPVSLTCWFNDGNAAIEVEFNSDQSRINELTNLVLTLTFPKSEKPDVTSTEGGDYELAGAGTLRYMIPRLSQTVPNSSIQIQFSQNLAEDDLFPINVDFELPHSFVRFEAVMAANLADNNQLLKFDVSKKCSADKFQIV